MCYRCEGMGTDGSCIHCGADMPCGQCQPTRAAWHMIYCEGLQARLTGGGCAGNMRITAAAALGSYPKADRKEIMRRVEAILDRQKERRATA